MDSIVDKYRDFDYYEKNPSREVISSYEPLNDIHDLKVMKLLLQFKLMCYENYTIGDWMSTTGSDPCSYRIISRSFD